MKTIELTRGKQTTIDDEDFEKVGEYKWLAKPSKGNWYAETHINGKAVFMHNFLMGRRQGLEIDHKDQDGLNNCKDNLRFSTPSQNRANVRIRADNKSGYKGVCFYAQTGKWRAYIQVNKKWKQLGYFLTSIEAAQAYNKAAGEAFGEFAWLNKI